ncbi:LysR family transcriptional regulator [Marinobacter sp. ATCH36]|uniref:LysR family transcriptional regulator n=1 Tax=Marinobacter sp. ATCH36 TaxID=2945106 RepID=UPI00202211C4|nr:LysR family transcriptional regulator [Marinobacter sp. ATCH36]MCL7943657.1 LysR family transcriptional regulator [Marinobacter sp. ATCH36]
MDEQSIRWDDLQIVWAISESGTLSGAGRRLKVSHATVFRRLGNLEKRLGVALFERSRTGYTPTPAGEDIAAVAQQVEANIKGAERRLAGRSYPPANTAGVQLDWARQTHGRQRA